MIIGYLFYLLPALSVGQDIEFTEIMPLESKVNSEAEEIMPLMNPEGILYFVRAFHDQNTGGINSGQDIWRYEFNTQGKVSRPDEIFWNSRGNDMVIGFRNEAPICFLLKTTGKSNEKIKGIYFVKKVDDAWSKPELIPIDGIISTGHLGMYMSPDFEVLILSMKRDDSLGEEDLYVSIKDTEGEWSYPENLGPTINTTGYEISPFLSKDKKKLYFSSNGHGGFGDADIFVGERRYDSWKVWAKPKNLGQEVNSSGFDAYFSIYGDSVAFFSSNRLGGLSDIFSARVLSNVGKNPNLIGIQPATSGEIANRNYLPREEVVEIFEFNFQPQLFFKKDDYEIDPAGFEMLYFIVQKILPMDDVRIALTGFADIDGDEAYNLSLSAQRALEVSIKLMSLGISAARISYDGLGIPDNASQGSEAAKSKDRRVDFKFYRVKAN